MQKYDVAAYIWPAYTGDEPRTAMFWPEGMGEWQSVRSAAAKFEGHQWPRKPLWGYQNEADPYVMEMQISAALDHGVNVFIYDWYWYDRRPFLENCLNDGFLKAKNHGDMKFYLMWANHDACTLWDKRMSTRPQCVVWQGAADEKEFRKVTVRLIENYFKLPEYYKIDGKPVFMIYDTVNFIKGAEGFDGKSGVQAARAALDWMREEAVRRGLPGLHLQMTFWNKNAMNLSGVDAGKDIDAYGLIPALGYDSLTHYQFVHFTDIDRDYADILPAVKAEWEEIEKKAGVPYFPHISVGWDNNPRYLGFRPGIVRNNTPEQVKKGFEMAKAYADAHPGQPPLVTVNSWNEWTETSYLEPDDLYGYGYLDALRDTFMKE